MNTQDKTNSTSNDAEKTYPHTLSHQQKGDWNNPPPSAYSRPVFHVAQYYQKEVDKLRKTTLRELKQSLCEASYQALKGVMWSFRRHFWNLKPAQQAQLAELFLHAPALKSAWYLRHELFAIYESPVSPNQAA